jgi:Na+/H+ antiporter NhaA
MERKAQNAPKATRKNFDSEGSGAIILMFSAAAAMIVPNSSLFGSYDGILSSYFGVRSTGLA